MALRRWRPKDFSPSEFKVYIIRLHKFNWLIQLKLWTPMINWWPCIRGGDICPASPYARRATIEKRGLDNSAMSTNFFVSSLTRKCLIQQILFCNSSVDSRLCRFIVKIIFCRFHTFYLTIFYFYAWLLISYKKWIIEIILAFSNFNGITR